jgi:hypothetical protein
LEQWDALFPVTKEVPTAVVDTATKSSSTAIPIQVEGTYGLLVMRFMNMCQERAIVPEFSFPQVNSALFKAKVVFNGCTCEEDGPFSSKKQAKEVLCQRAISVVEPMPLRTKKRKSLTAASVDEEDWKGKLNNHAQQNKHRPPLFIDHAIDTRSQQKAGLCLSHFQYACTLLIQAARGHVFGSQSTMFATKGDARRNAAKDAVLWLQANDQLSDSSTKQPKLSNSEPHIGAGATSSLNSDQGSNRAVHERSMQLGFTQPSYHTTPAESSGPSFYTAYATYMPQDSSREPRLQGPLCQTDPVYGQKNAKQACAQSLLQVLDQLVAERRSS